MDACVCVYSSIYAVLTCIISIETYESNPIALFTLIRMELSGGKLQKDITMKIYLSANCCIQKQF